MDWGVVNLDKKQEPDLWRHIHGEKKTVLVFEAQKARLREVYRHIKVVENIDGESQSVREILALRRIGQDGVTEMVFKPVRSITSETDQRELERQMLRDWQVFQEKWRRFHWFWDALRKAQEDRRSA